MSKKSGSYGIKLENPLSPSLKCHAPQVRKLQLPAPPGVAGSIKGDFLLQSLLGIIVFQLYAYLVELKESDMVGGRHRSGSLQAR